MMFFSYQRGDRGQVVRDIQQALNTTQAAGLEVDGIYGQQTDKSVTKIANYQNNSSRAASPAVFTEIGIPQIAIADISDHQYQVDFHKLRASGVRGVIIKASEGFDWKTKKIERFKEAKEATAGDCSLLSLLFVPLPVTPDEFTTSQFARREGTGFARLSFFFFGPAHENGGSGQSGAKS